MKINRNISLIIFFIILSGFCSVAKGFANKTHKAISEEAVIYSQTDAFIKNELGLNQGLGTMLLLDQSVIPAPERIPTAQFETRINPELPSNPCSILDFLKAGANLEDVPLPRARHHFHAPIANIGVSPPNPNSGLDNRTDHPNWALVADQYTQIRYGLHFDLTGASALKRASGIEDPNWEVEYKNYFAWPDTRDYFKKALTEPNSAAREHYLALTFLSLGQTVHLLEDTGVPAHTRNDFVYGHMRLTGIDPFGDWGNPFEAWVEDQVIDNNDQSPWSGTGPVVFDKLAKYFDADVYAGSYLGDGILPPSLWGLAECTNYQFLSFSTVFGCSGVKYQFPHPNEIYTSPLYVPVPGGKKIYFDGSNYGVTHLARESYTYYRGGVYGVYFPVIDSTNTTDDEKVFIDYANTTIPRTIDYATGLANYFFRGRLSVEPSSIDPNIIELTITNNSNNSGVPQTLKGGTFELYWDDASGNRSLVLDFTIDGGWEPSTTLAYGSPITGTFTHPTGAEKYILVYKGAISENAADPDTDDPDAIAVGIFEPPPCITNMTPDIGHPGSVLLIEGGQFSPIPVENTVRFDDVNGVYPAVYGTVLDADANGTWLEVELGFFDCCDVDYYFANTIVSANGKVSNPYQFKLTNWIWCTIKLWDGGESIDDEFDLYINDEYITTSYMDPPEDPTVVEIGFWYEDDYHFVDTYLYDSYEISGGTLEMSIEPYIDRVVAYRWNSTSEVQEFLYDNQYSGTFSGYFGSNLLVVPNDGIQLDVYVSLTYTGMEQAQSTTQAIGIVEESTANDSTSIREARGKPSPVDTVQRTYAPAKVHKKIRERIRSSSRTRRWYDKN